MKLVDCREIGREAALQLLKKPPFDAVVLSDKMRERNRTLFGADLSAAEIVGRIVGEVRAEGDAAVKRYTKLIDGADLADGLWATEAEFAAAEADCDPAVVSSLQKAADNIRRYHEEQKPKSWLTQRAHGSMLGQLCLPLERVGVYVPGGTAAYPSSVLMNAIPAAVAGVQEIVMAAPPGKDGRLNSYVLAAARIAGVRKVLKVGGAQAIAALAFGTESVPRVDKITGPGNLFVTLAKKAVYGHCDIDMLAGPSEILIVADKTADPVYLAADMLSQAEHDPLASSIVVTDSPELAQRVLEEAEAQLAALPRREIAAAALERNGYIIVTRSLEEAMALANASAPEHLEIVTAQPFVLLPAVRHAGAVFLGPHSPEPLGDYFAGPNHVLPTGGTARFYSVLNVETFMKRTSVTFYTKAALAEVAEDVVRLAETEGLTAHASAIRKRS